MNKRNGDRSFTYCRCHALDIATPHVAHGEQWVKIGGTWLHLRTCQECGGTHCCDNSLNRHATKHNRATGHPVIASAEPGERWLYCYPDDGFANY